MSITFKEVKGRSSCYLLLGASFAVSDDSFFSKHKFIAFLFPDLCFLKTYFFLFPFPLFCAASASGDFRGEMLLMGFCMVLISFVFLNDTTF